MKLSVINSGLFKLDGGAMFGVVPKKLWNRLNPSDENNLCTWAMRCLLIEIDDKKILVDTGMGDKQDERFRSHFEPHGNDSLIGSLSKNGLKAEDITDVFLTHLHFDHCGGAVKRDEQGKLVPTFPNATYWSNKSHYEWALNPNPRERASFLKENFTPLMEAGILNFVEEKEGNEIWNGVKIKLVYGHTEAMMPLEITYKNRKIIYCADLMPSSYHISMPYVMSYDIRPLETLKEKKILLENTVTNDDILFFEHDAKFECGTVKRNVKGSIVLNETFNLADIQ